MKKFILIAIVSFLCLEATAQNVGIGTISPNSNALLELQNNSNPLGLLLPRQDISTFPVMGASEAGIMVYNPTDNKVYTFDGNNWISSTSEWGVNGNDIFNLNSGNVGIGTNNPLRKIHIYDTAGFDGIRIENTDPTGGALAIFRNDNPAAIAQMGLNGSANGIYPNALFITQNGNHPIKFGTSFIDRMIITGAGDIGIGTLNPVARLHVQNSSSVGSQRGSLMAYSNNNSQSNAIVAVGSNSGLPSGFVYSRAHLAGYGNGPLGFADYGVWGHVPSGTWGVLASNGIDSIAPNTYAALGGLTHSALFMGGNVGLGTTNPSQTLDVEGRVAIYAGLNGDPTIRGIGAISWTRIGANGSGLAFWGNNNVDVDNIPQMFLNNLGYLGIGTTSPFANLHVSGTGLYTGRLELTATTDASGAANSGVLEIANTLRIDGNEIITNTNSPLYLQNDNNGDLFVDGNTLFVDASTASIGIGTTTQKVRLSVNGRLYVKGNGNPGTGDIFTPTIDLSIDDSDTGIDVPADGELSFYTNNQQRIRIRPSGYIGVRTSIPASDFHIKQTTSTFPNPSSGGLIFEQSGNTNRWQVWNSNPYLSFASNGTRVAYINDATGAWVTTSDARLKKDINNMPSILNKVEQLRPVSYKFNNRESEETTIGFLAQDVETLFPEVVSKDPGTDGYYGVAYGQMSVIAIKAIQELKAENDELRARIEALENTK